MAFSSVASLYETLGQPGTFEMAGEMKLRQLIGYE